MNNENTMHVILLYLHNVGVLVNKGTFLVKCTGIVTHENEIIAELFNGLVIRRIHPSFDHVQWHWVLDHFIVCWILSLADKIHKELTSQSLITNMHTCQSLAFSFLRYFTYPSSSISVASSTTLIHSLNMRVISARFSSGSVSGPSSSGSFFIRLYPRGCCCAYPNIRMSLLDHTPFQ